MSISLTIYTTNQRSYWDSSINRLLSIFAFTANCDNYRHFPPLRSSYPAEYPTARAGKTYPTPPPWEPSVFLLTCSDRYQQPQAIGTLQKAGRDLLFKKVSRKNPSILYQLALIFGIVFKSLIIKNFKLKEILIKKNCT